MGFENLILTLAGARCTSCDYQLVREDLDNADPTTELKCPKCQGKLRLNSPLVPAKLDKSNVAGTPTSQVKVTQQGSDFRLDIKWLSYNSRIISKAFVFIITFGVLIYIVFFKTQDRDLGLIFFLLIVALAGLWSAYSAICDIFNTTTILLKNNQLEFYTKPFSLKKKQVVNTIDIVNFSLEKFSVLDDESSKPITFDYFVNINLKNGNLIRLCKVQDLNEGAYVEKLLENKLGLKDDPNLDIEKNSW